MKKGIRIVIGLFAFAIAVFYIGPLITTGEMNSGVVAGLGVACVLFLYAVLFDNINLAVKKLNSKVAGKVITSVVCIVLALGIGIGGFALGNVVTHSGKSNHKTEYAIVLGCVVRGDQPGIFLKKRINSAYEYLKDNPDSKAVLSGGQGNGENISEAQCMYNELTQMGIESSRLILEDKSTSTKENFENSVRLLKNNGVEIDEITVVTNDFHEYRASKFAERSGLKAYQYPCKTPWNGYMPFATREAFAVVYQVYMN